MGKPKVFSVLLVSIDPLLREKAKELGRILAISQTSNTTHLGLASGVDVSSALKTVTERLIAEPAQIVVLLGRTPKIDPNKIESLLSAISPKVFIITASDPAVDDLAKQVVAQTGQKPARAGLP